MEPIKKRKGYPSNNQKTRLVQLIQADEELRSGKFSATFTKKVAEERWAAITIELNSIPGAKKSWTEWRRTWQDMKAKTKKKETGIRRCHNGTGGGPPPTSLSEEDMLVLSTISKTELEGHAGTEESLVYFRDMPSTSQTSGSYMEAQDMMKITLGNDSGEESNLENCALSVVRAIPNSNKEGEGLVTLIEENNNVSNKENIEKKIKLKKIKV